MNKKIVMLALALTFSLVSCKKSDNADDAQDVANASEEAVIFDVADVSFIEWVGSKPAGKHNGTINVSTGEVTAKDGMIESGRFVIDMSSINVLDLEGDDKLALEAHLKGTAEGKEDHFFDVATHPEGIFEITSVTAGDAGTTVSGNLTLKGITKNVTFNAAVNVTDNTFEIISDEFKINRTDWGINFMSKSIFDDLKDKFIDDEIVLKVAVKGVARN